jgi:hypothetical protein
MALTKLYIHLLNVHQVHRVAMDLPHISAGTELVFESMSMHEVTMYQQKILSGNADSVSIALNSLWCDELTYDRGELLFRIYFHNRLALDCKNLDVPLNLHRRIRHCKIHRQHDVVCM